MVSHDVKIRVVILFEFYETSPRRVSCISYEMTTGVKPEYITNYEITYMCVSCSCHYFVILNISLSLFLS